MIISIIIIYLPKTTLYGKFSFYYSFIKKCPYVDVLNIYEIEKRGLQNRKNSPPFRKTVLLIMYKYCFPVIPLSDDADFLFFPQISASWSLKSGQFLLLQYES